MKKLMLAGLVTASVLVGNVSAKDKIIEAMEGKPIVFCLNESDAVVAFMTFMVSKDGDGQNIGGMECYAPNISNKMKYLVLDKKVVPVGKGYSDVIHAKIVELKGENVSDKNMEVFIADPIKVYVKKYKL
jgi:hypothetical protein